VLRIFISLKNLSPSAVFEPTRGRGCTDWRTGNTIGGCARNSPYKFQREVKWLRLIMEVTPKSRT
jgi:hypothetical protein